ncbi:MAG: cupin domain-containing protein [Flavobacteriia bacterium]|jgi:quercetin dioxygenase-like cupin family protein
MKTILFLLFTLPIFIFGQSNSEINEISPDKPFENVYSKKIADDSLQSTFIIWVKKDVVEHYHQTHTENIYVLEGKAEMTLNGQTQVVKKGDYMNIPLGTKHAVTKVLSRKPFKVLSIQSPHFDGTDRIIIKQPHCDF